MVITSDQGTRSLDYAMILISDFTIIPAVQYRFLYHTPYLLVRLQGCVRVHYHLL